MYTTAARICALRPKALAGYWVPDRLAALVASRADAPVNDLPEEEVLLCVSGRWAMPDLDRDLDVREALVEAATDHVVAAHLPRAWAEYFLSTGELHESVQVRRLPQRVLYRYPWDVLAFMKQTIREDILSTRLEGARVPADVADVCGDHAVDVHASATVGPRTVFDAAEGPILVHEQAVIRPGCVICGPCAIGPGATVVDRAHIKPNTVIGPGCKVGGEVGTTIFQGHSNKAHEGHIGDSWVGKWVNLGAGTTVSNLLNTYGEVTMRIEPEGPRQRTGLTFLGAVIGDHVKTAICTRIMTGSVIGTGAMIATTVPPPASVRRFAWITDDGERTFRLDKFLEVCTRMMARRDRKPSAAYRDAIVALHGESVASKRQDAALGRGEGMTSAEPS
jgi:UDP-N-acetylglucosamine diphosphorylase/glucosamine-1-phosphate N-acetyltransferase